MAGKKQKTIEKIVGVENPQEIPFYQESTVMLIRVHETAELLVDDAAKNMHYRTWADFCTGLAKVDGTRWYFKKLADYFRNQAKKYSPQESLEREGKT